MWCSALQTHSESLWKHVEDEQHLVETSVRDTQSLTVTSTSLDRRQGENGAAKKQTCDIVQWNYRGFGSMAEKENDFQHSLPEPCAKKQEESDLMYSGEDVQTDVPDSSRGQMQNNPGKNQCPTCLKCFSAPSKLRRHAMIHTSQRPFGCHLCTKAFRQLAHLKIHLTTHFSQRQSKLKPKWQNDPSGAVPPNQDQSLGTSEKYCSRAPEGQWAAENKVFKEGPPVAPVTKKSKLNRLFPQNGENVNLVDEHLSRGKIMHECPVCFKCFSAPSKLRRHCLIHTGQRPFQCSTCYRSFRQLAHLKAHYSVHTGPWKKRTSALQTLKFVSPLQPPSKVRLKRFMCNSLNRKFRSGKHLSFSVEKCKTSPTPVLSQSPTESLTVDADVSNSIGFESSYRSREGYWCTVCCKHFSAPSKLRRHLLIHTGQRPFKCMVCSRAFTQRSHLKVHRCKGESRGAFEKMDSPAFNTNITEGAVNGEQCSTVESTVENFIPSGSFMSHYIPGGKEFGSLSYRADVEVPGITVTSKQNKECGHQCTICLKMFDFPSKLSRHLLIHMDIKPFTCAVCSKSFRQLCHLQSHEKVHVVKRKIIFKGGHRHRIVAPKAAAASGTSELLNENCNQRSGNIPLLQKPDPVMGSSGNQDLLLSKCNKFEPSAEKFSVACEADVDFPPDGCRDEPSQTPDTVMAAKVATEDPSSPRKKQNVNQCSYCLKTFDFPSKLSRHVRIHTGIRPYECNVCRKSFKQLSHLQCHQWIHRKDKTSFVGRLSKHQNPVSSGCVSTEEECVPGPCQERLESFNMVQGHDAYQEHLLNWNSVGFDQIGPTISDHKDSKIKSEADLQVDRAVNLVLKHETVIGTDGVCRSLSWECADRNKPSGQYEERTENKRDVHCCVPEDSSNRSPTVSDCCRLGRSHEQQDPSDFRGPKREALEEGEKQFAEPPNDLPICPACSQCFPTVKKLQAHKCPKQGPEEKLRKSYHCAVCFKTFEAPSKLKRHYVIHTGQRPFQCTMCHKAFTQSGHLKTHILSHR